MAKIGKPAWLSKTNAFGVLWIIVGIAGLFGFADFTPSSDLVEVGSIVNGIVIIILRFVTKEPVYLNK